MATLGCDAPRHRHAVSQGGGHEDGPARYRWLSTRCADGQLPLAETGFAQTLELLPAARGHRLLFEAELPDRGCDVTSLWAAEPRFGAPEDSPLRLTPLARVSLPGGVACGPAQQAFTSGRVQTTGATLVLTVRRSAWCRGLQAEVSYRRVAEKAPQELEAAVIARRFLAYFGAGDAGRLSAMFASSGSLLEPFSARSDGGLTRHEGRAAVGRYLHDAFVDRAWVALRALGVQRLPVPGQWAASFEYMDPDLASPLRARVLLVIADGEVFEAQLQLLSLPVPGVAPTGLRAELDAGLPDAGPVEDPGAESAAGVVR